MAFEDRRYVIIPVTELDNVDFAQVLETAPETCRRSLDGTQTFVKYLGTQPACIDAITTKSPEYTHTQILEILSTSRWTVPHT